MIIKNARRTAVALALVAVGAVSAQAQNTATQTVTFAVSAINQLALTATTATLTINTATAGFAPTSATSAAGTWAVTTNQSTAKITASIPALALPAGVTLSASFGNPAGATSAGLKALSSTPVDLVTVITKVAQAGMGVSYQLDATTAAGVVAATPVVVTYTLTGGT
jgi:hypothetical protein